MKTCRRFFEVIATVGTSFGVTGETHGASVGRRVAQVPTRGALRVRGVRAPRVGVGMSRKASERRFNPDAFVEANLWVVTRGRPYKPRFRAERAVVIVSGGGAVRADAQVAPPRTVHGHRAAVASSGADNSSDPPRHPLAAVLGAADAAAALFQRTACDAVYVLDFGPLCGDMPTELASPYPGRVAKPAARLLQKLNVSDALLAASGADVSVLLKVLASAAENAKAVVLHEPDAAARGVVLAGVRAAVSDGAARRLKENLRIRYSVSRNDESVLNERHGSVRSLLSEAFPEADARDAVDGEDGDENLVSSEEKIGEGKKNARGKRARFADAVASAARALESRDGVPPAAAWLAAADAPVFYARVTFEHDKNSKQIEQVVRNVTDAVAAARRERREEEKEEETALVPEKNAARDSGDDETRTEEAVSRDAEPTAATKNASDARDVSERRSDAETETETETDPKKKKKTDSTDSAVAPVVYVATRPFHPARLAKTLRAHFARLDMTPEVPEVSSGAGGAAAVAAAAARAAEAATEAASEAERMVRALTRQSRGASGGADPAAAAAAASAAASASASAASASAASAAATLLSRLMADEDREPVGAETRGELSERAEKNATASRHIEKPYHPPAGPFAGVLASRGAVWLANRPFVRGAWSTPDARRPGNVTVACAGAWDSDSSAFPVDARVERASPDALDADSNFASVFVGARRVELVFEGTSAMDERSIRDALDACLVTEAETSQKALVGDGEKNDDVFSTSGETGSDVRDVEMCFAPWPDQAAHLASLGVRLRGRGSAALAMAAASGLHAWQKNAAAAEESDKKAASSWTSETPSARDVTLGSPPSAGGAGLRFGGAVGVHRPEAFVAPAKGTDVKQFPEGTGFFWPKMPCLECGSPWWLGDSWYAACANCGGDAESYDNEQKPHKAYKRRFARFRELVEELRGTR